MHNGMNAFIFFLKLLEIKLLNKNKTKTTELSIAIFLLFHFLSMLCDNDFCNVM